MRNPHSCLPPGFRFHPTDEELILHYLSKKVESTPLPVSIIAEVDIYKFDPWELPDKALFGEKEWYFFSPRERKYPNGARPNRAAASGYWKATGTDKTIMASFAGAGVKKALVFYKGRPPKGVKTNWIMHEYRLIDTNKPIKFKNSSMRLDDWVLCRIYQKLKYVLPSTPEETGVATVAAGVDYPRQVHEHFVHNDHNILPDMKPSFGEKQLVSQKSLSFTNILDAMDYSLLSSFLSENSINPTEFGLTPELNGRQQQQQQQQPFSANSRGSYLYQKLSQLKSASPTNMENRLKLQNTDMVDQDTLYSSKKYVNSCSTVVDHSYQIDISQRSVANHSPWFTEQKDLTVEHDTIRLDNRLGILQWN